jgi:AmmeMemoRadiSam system protein B
MSAETIRRPAVAGSFYPRARDELASTLDSLFAKAGRPGARARAIGIVAPHAGYVYSGGVAAKVYAAIEVPSRVLILAPNHTGLGARLSLFPPGRWMLPLGDVAIDEPLTTALREKCGLDLDVAAHLREHAAEVQVPFIQRERPGATIAAVVIGTHERQALEKLGRGIAAALDEVAPDALIVASSDMNHYESHERTIEKDTLAIDRVLALDPAGLLEVCEAHDISMCGVAPTAAMLWAALARGAKTARLIDHRTSGEVYGEWDRVVGYAGIVVS